MDGLIPRALFSMGFGALGALAIQGVVWLVQPKPPRFGQVDLVAIMQSEVEQMARKRVDGDPVDPAERSARIQQAVDSVAEAHGRVLLAKQALMAAPAGAVPDLTVAVRRRLGADQ